MRVSIRECGGEYREWDSTVSAENKHTAVSAAIRQHFGADASWHSHGPDWGYGVAVEPAHAGGSAVISPDLSVQVFDDDENDITREIV
jgi:hypothetical protein